VNKSLLRFSVIFLVCAASVSGTSASLENTEASLVAFLEENSLVTYDCPDPKSFDQTESYISQINNFTEQHQLHLGVLYSHHLICIGQPQTAEIKLRSQLESLQVDKTSEIYARATYALGLALDFQEKEERCVWYLRARELSENAIADVNVSSRLGLITYCSTELPVFELLEKSYEVLEDYSDSKNNGLLAHIHNSIGLLYGFHNMHFLAAEQYIKAHELGLSVYTGSNRVAALVSAIVSLNASGQFDQVIERLEEFKTLSDDINSPMTQVFYLFQLANYYTAIDDYEPMRPVLKEWEELLPLLANRRYNVFHALFSAMLCEYDKDVACVSAYLDSIENADMPQMHILNNNDRYKRLLVRGYLLVGDVDKARIAFEDYLELEILSKKSADKHDIALQVSQLREKIQRLQGKIENEKRYQRPIIIVLGILITIFVGIGFVLRRHATKQAQLDPVTCLLNSDAIVGRIERLDEPADGKIHALVIFYLSNFNDVNVALGMTKGDFILQKLANTLRSATRDHDLIGRMSTEQFIICLTDISEQHFAAFVDRTTSELELKFLTKDGVNHIGLTCSSSVFITSDKFTNLDKILKDLAERLVDADN